MRILGIESSCDETAASVLDDGRVLSNVIASQIPIHARFGGVVPELASRNHLMAFIPVIEQALTEAGCGLDGIDRLAVTQGPGLLGALLVGLQAAKGLVQARKIPLVPVHHVEGHITAVLLDDGGEGGEAPPFPYVALAVSGGHSSIYRVDGISSYHRLGCTLDDAAGEAFDKVARLMGLPYPGGVSIDRLSEHGDPERFAFPRALPRRDDFNFSFSGLKTATRNTIQGLDLDDEQLRKDLAASFQEAVVDSLVTKTTRAARSEGSEHVVVSGGVAANRRLRARFAEVCDAEGLKLHLTRFPYCTDNAAMIAGVGRFREPLSPAQALALEPFASRELG